MNDRVNKLMKDPKKGLIKLAIPMIISMVFSTMLYFVDTIFVGGLGSEALAGVGLAFPIFFLVFAFGMGVSIGTTALISKRMGEKNKQWAEETALHGLLIAGIMAVIFTSVAFFTGSITPYLGGGELVSSLSAQYLEVLFGGVSIFFILFALEAILRGEGDTKTPMKLSIVYTVTNAILDPIFIYSLNMGVRGAALATVTAGGLALLLYLWYIVLAKKSYLQINFREFIYTPQIIKNILGVGMPSAVAQAMLSVAVLGVNWILSGFGDSAIAAYTVGFRIDSLAILPMLGLAGGVVPMMGFYRGSKDWKGARKVERIAIKYVFVFGVIGGAVIFLLSGILPTFFSSDSEVIGMATEYLRISSLSYAFLGTAIVLSSAFQGLGKGMHSLGITMTRAVLFVIPISYYLAYYTDLGVTGVWIGVATSMVLAATLAFLWIESYFKKLCASC